MAHCVDEKVLHCCFDSVSVVRRSEDGISCFPDIVVDVGQ